LTGATGDLTPDSDQRDFEPGEWREASDAAHQADVTRAQASHAQEHHPLTDAERAEHDAEGHEEPDARESRIGGDEAAEAEEHF
jgi:hypothetical protein